MSRILDGPWVTTGRAGLPLRRGPRPRGGRGKPQGSYAQERRSQHSSRPLPPPPPPPQLPLCLCWESPSHLCCSGADSLRAKRISRQAVHESNGGGITIQGEGGRRERCDRGLAMERAIFRHTRSASRPSVRRRACSRVANRCRGPGARGKLVYSRAFLSDQWPHTVEELLAVSNAVCLLVLLRRQ